MEYCTLHAIDACLLWIMYFETSQRQCEKGLRGLGYFFAFSFLFFFLFFYFAISSFNFDNIND